MTTKYRVVEAPVSGHFAAVVGVRVVFENGFAVRGSGAVVGPNDVLTAAHLLNGYAGAGAVRTVEVTSALGGVYAAASWRTNTVDADGDGQLSQSDTQADFALLTVSDPDPIGAATGWFEIAGGLATPGRSIYLHSAGYPTGPQDGALPLEMIETFGYEVYDGVVLRHSVEEDTDLDWSGGSGSAFYVAPEDGAPARIVGVLSTGEWAGYVTPEVADTLAGWIAENDAMRLFGGDEADALAGGPCDDLLVGRGGDDVIAGYDGDDLMRGNGGSDILRGGRGEDALYGGSGDDVLHGNAGADKLIGANGKDVLYGGADNDILRGGRHNDLLKGGGGDDLLDGAKGKDLFWGGRGADVFHFDAGDGRGDRVKDFSTKMDRVEIGVGASDFADLTLVADARHDRVTLEFANVRVLFEGLGADDIDHMVFDFV